MSSGGLSRRCCALSLSSCGTSGRTSQADGAASVQAQSAAWQGWRRPHQQTHRSIKCGRPRITSGLVSQLGVQAALMTVDTGEHEALKHR